MKIDRRLAALGAIALGIGLATGGLAQTMPNLEQFGDSASLSSGAPIAAPTTADPGAQVPVSVQNAREGAMIELWGPVTEQGRGNRLAAVPLTAGSATLTAPTQSASYELRYVGPNGSQLGRRAFDVAAVPVVLTVPTPVAPGGTLTVTWKGPANPGDRLEIVGPGGAVLATAPAGGSQAGENVTELMVPQQQGTLELRYVTGGGGVLRTIRFDVVGG